MSGERPASHRSGVVLGIDLGGTKVHGALAHPDGSILAEAVRATDPRGGAAIIDQLEDLSGALLRDAGVGVAQVVATGIGSPGVTDPRTGEVHLSPNIPGLESLDFRTEVGRLPGRRVRVENDVNAAALGELRFGTTGLDDFAFVALGTGIGMGIVSERRLLRGARGAAGEIGFLPLHTEPLDRANQVGGPLEAGIGGPRIARAYARATGRRVSTTEVFDRAGGGEEAARAVVRDVAYGLALGLLAVRAVLDPGAFVLGGSVGTREELRGPLDDWLAALTASPPAVLTTTLGPRAAVLGAIALATDPTPDQPEDAR